MDFSFVRACLSLVGEKIYFQIELSGSPAAGPVSRSAYGATNATRQLRFELRSFVSAPSWPLINRRLDLPSNGTFENRGKTDKEVARPTRTLHDHNAGYLTVCTGN